MTNKVVHTSGHKLKFLMINFFALFVISLFSTSLVAHDTGHSKNSSSLTPDETIVGSEFIQFPNDDRIYPDKSDFQLLHTIIMSNPKGERWTTLTVKNLSSGLRSFHQDQVQALLADGSRRSPLRFERKFKGDETLSIIVNFGKSKFPILQVETRN